MNPLPLDDPMIRQLIATYLGPVAAQADSARPWLLLELAPGAVSPRVVIAATQRQLAKIAASVPPGSTEAAQLRMVVQEAAAQVMANAAGEGDGPDLTGQPQSGGKGVARAQPQGARPLPAPDPGLLRDAEGVIAKFGGIDAQSLATLNAMAAARGLPPTAVPAVLNALVRPDMPTTQEASAASGGDASKNEEDPEEDPGVAFLKRALLVGVLVFVVLVGVLAAGLIVLSGRRPSGGGGADTEPSIATGAGVGGGPAEAVAGESAKPEASTPAAEGEAEKKTTGPTRADIEDGSTADVVAIIRQTRRCVELVSTSPADAAKLFKKHVRVLGQSWARMDAGQRTATSELVVDYLYKCAADARVVEEGVETIAAMAAPLADETRRMGSGEIGPVSWSCGMLLRLTRERDLAGSAVGIAERGLTKALSRDRPTGSFKPEAGAMAALRLMPLRIVDRRPQTDEEVKALAKRGRGDPAETARAFSIWEQCVRACTMVSASGGVGTEGERQASELIVLEGLERAMRDAVEPDEDRSVTEAIGMLATRLRWREQESARRRLVVWFDDQTISNADLQTLTGAIVTKSSAEGVDVTMVLTHGATGEQRAQLKDAYASAWGLKQGVTGGALAEQWIKTAREQLARTAERDPALLEEMRSTAILAKINEAAARRARGDNAGAAEILTLTIPVLMPAGSIALSALPPNTVVMTIIMPKTAGSGGRDGEWALKFLTERARLEQKVISLKELETAEVGPIDAEVLAETAMTASESQVRLAAQRTCVALQANGAVVNAMLRSLPKASRRGDVAQTIERVTGQPLVGWQSERWPLEARRALVERLLELVATDSSSRPMDHLAAAVAEAYQAAAGNTVSPGGVSDEDAGRTARDGAAALFKRLRAQAEAFAPNPAAPVALDVIERQHAGRLALARGVVQQFAADQVACAELLAYVVTGEQPGRGPVVATIMRTLTQKRREAITSIEQTKHTEAAMVRLWMLRAGEEAP